MPLATSSNAITALAATNFVAGLVRIACSTDDDNPAEVYRSRPVKLASNIPGQSSFPAFHLDEHGHNSADYGGGSDRPCKWWSESELVARFGRDCGV